MAEPRSGISGRALTTAVTPGSSATSRAVRSTARGEASLAVTLVQRPARASASDPVPQAASQACSYRTRDSMASSTDSLRRSYQLPHVPRVWIRGIQGVEVGGPDHQPTTSWAWWCSSSSGGTTGPRPGRTGSRWETYAARARSRCWCASGSVSTTAQWAPWAVTASGVIQ